MALVYRPATSGADGIVARTMEASKAPTAGHAWPITLENVLSARARIRSYIAPTPFRRYAPLDAAVGRRIEVWVKHENYCPTNSFKARNALSAMSALTPQEKARGVVAATRGNHGLGVAWGGSLLGVCVTICVPRGNNPEKNDGMRGYGATLVEEGKDYDESLATAQRLAGERGLTMLHSTNDPRVIAGAATLSFEMLEERPELDAIVLSVGGGSQAVGALTVARALKPAVEIFAVQAEKASAAHDSWKAGYPVPKSSADTFADGLATRSVYEMTFPTLREGLADFLLVSEGEIARAVRLLLSTTHSLVEGAGAAGLAGLLKLSERLSGKKVGIVLSGGNIDAATLSRVVNGEIR
jgi:threonine dehydratase